MAEPDDPLAGLREDIRRTPGPELDFEQLGSRLMRDIERGAHPRWPTPERDRWLAGYAAAALVVLGFGLAAWLRPVADRVEAPVANAARNAAARDRAAQRTPLELVGARSARVRGTQLMPGDRIHAGARGSVIEHPAATWSLAPNASAEVVTIGDVVSVRLHQGELHAEVSPSALPASFTVLYAEAEVSVHGTVFDVRQTPDGFAVNVAEGVVAVGPLAGGERTLVRSGMALAFSKQGTEAKNLRAEERQTGPRISAGTPPRISSTPTPPAASLEPKRGASLRSGNPSTPTSPNPQAMSETPTATITQLDTRLRHGLEEQLNGCFHASKSSDTQSVEVEVTVRVHLDVTAEGQLLRARFEPPLAPSVFDCVERGLPSLSFPSSAAGQQLTGTLRAAF